MSNQNDTCRGHYFYIKDPFVYQATFCAGTLESRNFSIDMLITKILIGFVDHQPLYVPINKFKLIRKK